MGRGEDNGLGGDNRAGGWEAEVSLGGVVGHFGGGRGRFALLNFTLSVVLEVKLG